MRELAEKLRLLDRRIKSVNSSIEHWHSCSRSKSKDAVGAEHCLNREMAELERLTTLKNRIEGKLMSEIEAEFGGSDA